MGNIQVIVLMKQAGIRKLIDYPLMRSHVIAIGMKRMKPQTPLFRCQKAKPDVAACSSKYIF